MLDLKKIEAAIAQISAEKKIPKESLIAIIEAAIKTAYKKDYGSKDENVNVKLDLEAGEIEISLEKELVEVVEDPATQMALSELGDDAEDYEVGDVIEIDVTDEVMQGGLEETFGRIASQAARQVIIQKIGDTEKQKIYDLFQDKVGQCLSMKVVMVESGKVIMDYNGNHVVLPKSEQVSRDQYIPDARFYIYVSEVTVDEKMWPRVTLSRKSPQLVTGIFEMYVPELADWGIVVENIARYPGVKTKILVSTPYEEIDPAGSMIGQKGMRVKSVMDELSGERVDIVVNNGNLYEMVTKAMSPATIKKINIDEENAEISILIDPEERPKALGKNGVNVNLASQLLGCNITVISDEPAVQHEAEEESEDEE